MKPNSDSYPLTANRTVRLDVQGRYVHIKEATGTVFIRFDEEKPIELEKYMGALDADGYRRLEITSPTDQTVTIIQSSAPINDSRVSSQTALATDTTDAIKDGFGAEIRDPATATALKEKSLDTATIAAIQTAVANAVQASATATALKEKSLDAATITALGAEFETRIVAALTTYNAAQNA